MTRCTIDRNFSTVGGLQAALRAEGWREDGFARWTKSGDARTLVIKGDVANGFYLAEFRR